MSGASSNTENSLNSIISCWPYLQNFKYNVPRMCIFRLVLILSGKNREGEWKKSIKRDKSYLSTIPKNSAFSKSLIVMKCFKYLICVLVKHWILNCQSLIENQEERTTWPRPPRQNGNSVNLSFYFNHRYIHISK